MKFINFCICVLIVFALTLGCTSKSAKQIYLPMYLEYRADLLSPVVEFPNLKIKFQPIKGWDAIVDKELKYSFSKLSSESNLTVASVFQLPNTKCINVIGQLARIANTKDADFIQRYLHKMSSQCDTTFTIGKFSHNDILYDQLIAQRADLVYIQLIGQHKTFPGMLSVTYIIPEGIYKDMIKKVEASISSIEINGR
jgi:hypothetical protein